MARVRFPLIVRSIRVADLHVDFACEDAKDKNGNFGWVQDQLEATVYKDSRHFLKCWSKTATEAQEEWDQERYKLLYENDFVYVGE